MSDRLSGVAILPNASIDSTRTAGSEFPDNFISRSTAEEILRSPILFISSTFISGSAPSIAKRIVLSISGPARV